MEATSVSINRWMDKEDVIYTYNGILLRDLKKKKEILLYVTTWMDLEDINIMFSEISQRKKSESEVAQLCPTLCDPMDCSLPRSSIYGILQARILEWVAVSFSRRSSQPRDCTEPESPAL